MKQSLLTGLVVFVVVFGFSSRSVDGSDRFIDNGNGTVTDTQTGLMWAAKDNGQNINWDDAKKYCENYKGGGYSDWRMPTIRELQSLYDSSINGNNRYHLTKLITLTNRGPWSVQTIDSSVARYFDFGLGGAYTEARNLSYIYRALPVRSTPLVNQVQSAPAPADDAQSATDDRCYSARFGFSYQQELSSRTNGQFPLYYVSLSWTISAQFPNAAKTYYDVGNFSLTCGAFSAHQSQDESRIRGKSLTAVYNKLQDVRMFYVAGWDYPAIHVGFYSATAKLVITNDQVTIEPDKESSLKSFFRESVVAARINGGALQPLLFEGTVSPIRIGPTDVVDLFAKGNYLCIPRVSIDAKSSEMVFYKSAEFPEK